MRTAGGRTVLKAIVGHPRGLRHGKDTWPFFTAATEFFTSFREQGAKGICIYLYLQDGKFVQKFARCMRGRHALYYQAADFDEDDDVQELALAEWVLSINCKSHSMSNAVAWSLRPWKLPEIEKDAHVSIRSLINTSESLHRHIDLFCQQAVVFRERDHDPADVEQFWRFLLVKPNMLPAFLVADPVWDGEHVVVSKEFEERNDALHVVKAVELYCASWRDWSETRWCKARSCARLYIRSLVVGVEGLISEVQHDGAADKVYLGGHARSSFEIRRYLIIAACSATCPDHVNARLLQDDRFFKFGAQLRIEMAAELRNIAQLCSLVWQRLAFILGGQCTWMEVRDQCIYGSCIACGYMELDAFMSLDCHPFSMTQGDIAENVRNLSVSDPSDLSDYTVIKARGLLDRGFAFAAVVGAFGELAELLATVGSVEKAHGFSAVLNRDHHIYSCETLSSRSTLNSSRCLFLPDAEQKKIDKLEEKWTSWIASSLKENGIRWPFLSLWT